MIWMSFGYLNHVSVIRIISFAIGISCKILSVTVSKLVFIRLYFCVVILAAHCSISIF